MSDIPLTPQWPVWVLLQVPKAKATAWWHMSEMTPTRSTNRMEFYFKISAHSGEEKYIEGAFQFYYNISQLMLNAYTVHCLPGSVQSCHSFVEGICTTVVWAADSNHLTNPSMHPLRYKWTSLWHFSHRETSMQTLRNKLCKMLQEVNNYGMAQRIMTAHGRKLSWDEKKQMLNEKTNVQWTTLLSRKRCSTATKHLAVSQHNTKNASLLTQHMRMNEYNCKHSTSHIEVCLEYWTMLWNWHIIIK